MTPRDRYRQNVADALTHWRMFCIVPRPDPNSAAREIINTGIGEIAALRLQLVYLPILKSLDRIERHFTDIVTQLQPAQYAKGKLQCPFSSETKPPIAMAYSPTIATATRRSLSDYAPRSR